MKVIVVEDDYPSRELLRIFIEKEGFQCQVASDGLEGFNLFKKSKPDIVITDIRMPKMDGLELLNVIRKISKDVIIIFITGHGNEEIALRALELGANNYLKKPIDLSEIRRILQNYSSILEKRTTQANISDLVRERSIEIEIESDITMVQALSSYLVQKTGNIFDSKEKIRIELGLTELLMNAIEHGNWGISCEEKNKALLSNTINDLFASKLENLAFKNKKVNIKYLQNGKYAEWIITDEGLGFNWKVNLSSVNNYQNNVSGSGRGIYLIKMQFDDVEYNDKGNVVKVKKYYKE